MPMDTVLPVIATPPAGDLQRERQVAARRIADSQQNSAARYDHDRVQPSYSVGQKVYVWRPTRKVGRAEKLLHQFHGPFPVVRQTSPVNYEVAISRPRKGVSLEVIHVTRLKPAFPRTPESGADSPREGSNATPLDLMDTHRRQCVATVPESTQSLLNTSSSRRQLDAPEQSEVQNFTGLRPRQQTDTPVLPLISKSPALDNTDEVQGQRNVGWKYRTRIWRRSPRLLAAKTQTIQLPLTRANAASDDASLTNYDEPPESTCRPTAAKETLEVATDATPVELTTPTSTRSPSDHAAAPSTITAPESRNSPGRSPYNLRSRKAAT